LSKNENISDRVKLNYYIEGQENSPTATNMLEVFIKNVCFLSSLSLKDANKTAILNVNEQNKFAIIDLEKYFIVTPAELSKCPITFKLDSVTP
jgi:hypothetical protein